MDLLPGRDPSLTSAGAAYALATALLCAGNAARAVAVLVEGTGGDDVHLLPAVPRVGACELLTRCCLALGRRHEATRAATLADGYADALGLQTVRAVADRALAALALDGADCKTAAWRALRSASTADGVGAVLEAAQARVVAGRALAGLDERQRAAGELRIAAATFDRCGAPRLRDGAEHELRRIGYRRRTADPGGPQSGPRHSRR